MGSCQNYGPFLGTLNIRCRIIKRTQKGTIILTTTHVFITELPALGPTNVPQKSYMYLFSRVIPLRRGTFGTLSSKERMSHQTHKVRDKPGENSLRA